MNPHRRFLGLLCAAALGLAAPMAAQSQVREVAASARTKVVFQVDDNEPARWGLTLNNIRNAQVDLGEDEVEIELVAYGPGIAMLKSDSPMAKRIDAALKAGVKVVACENTMKGQKLVVSDMLPGIGYVPSGVVELISKQRQGYAYIRP